MKKKYTTKDIPRLLKKHKHKLTPTDRLMLWLEEDGEGQNTSERALKILLRYEGKGSKASISKEGRANDKWGDRIILFGVLGITLNLTFFIFKDYWISWPESAVLWLISYGICEFSYIREIGGKTSFKDFVFGNLLVIPVSALLMFSLGGYYFLIQQLKDYYSEVLRICGAILIFLIVKLIIWALFVKGRGKKKRRRRRLRNEK